MQYNLSLNLINLQLKTTINANANKVQLQGLAHQQNSHRSIKFNLYICIMPCREISSNNGREAKYSSDSLIHQNYIKLGKLIHII